MLLLHEPLREWKWLKRIALAQNRFITTKAAEKFLGVLSSGGLHGLWKNDWGRLEQECLRAIITGAAPSQDVLFEKGLAVTSLCQRCQAARGSPWHRHWMCDTLDSWVSRCESLERFSVDFARSFEDLQS